MTHPLTDLLLTHRQSGTLISSLPDYVVPRDAAEAYRVQTESVKALGPVGAWKVQPIPQSGEPFASPILANTVFPDGAALKSADFPGLAIEVEVAVTIGHDLPARESGYAAGDMREVIASLHVGLEILASRFPDRTKNPQLVGIADLQNSGGVVLGPAIAAEELPEFAQQQMSLQFDGAEVQSTTSGAATDNMLAALAWLANHAAARGLPLKKGDVVITGSRLGPISFAGEQVFAAAEGLGTVSCTFG
ncbi:2-keto-4-pentenoate hydratase [Devosia submarina]|uniref:2-keto-4-pentenoate hydratase n=1 Tax=Devosia submarina TaxID=1173082 RepID=UPI000D3D8119|nr:fumarylacetoacetate hydrolase family protein [Devosia submarina]